MKRLILLFCLSMFLLVGCAGDDTPEVKATEGDAVAESVTDVVGGPFTAEEFAKFLKDIPEVTRMTEPALNPNKNNGKEITPEEVGNQVFAAAKSLGWEEKRFMYVYGQSMAVMNLDQVARMQANLGEQMEGMTEEQKATVMQMMGPDMEGRLKDLKQMVDQQVPASEQEIIRANMDDLYTALGIRQ